MKTFTLVGLATLSAFASAVTVNFDNFTSGTIVSNQYPGVVFSSLGGATTRTHQFTGATSAENILCTFDANGNLTCLDLVSLTFTAPVNGLTFWAIEPNAVGTAVVGAIFQNGTFTGNFNIPGLNGGGNGFVDLSGFNNITKLELRISSEEQALGGVGYDDFNFTPVPEPASMLALGGAALLLIRRRR